MSLLSSLLGVPESNPVSPTASAAPAPAAPATPETPRPTPPSARTLAGGLSFGAESYNKALANAAVPPPRRLVIQDEPSILAPDAPSSKPELASKPIEVPVVEVVGVTPPPEAPKKRGRPPGSKNLPKEHTRELVYAPVEVTKEQVEASTAKGDETVPAPKDCAGACGKGCSRAKVKEVTVSHHTRLGLPGYSSHEFSISMTADVTGDVDAAVKALSDDILAKVKAELAPIAAAAAAKAAK